MKAVIAIDSFKGSLTSLEAGNAAKRGILRACPDAEVTVIPVADGGEGTIDSIAPFVGGIPKTVTVTGPLGKPVEFLFVFWHQSSSGKYHSHLSIHSHTWHPPVLTLE